MSKPNRLLAAWLVVFIILYSLLLIGASGAGFSPTNIAGMAYYWNFNDLPYNKATTGWTDRIQHVVLTNFNRSGFNPSNSALGLRFPNNGSASTLLSNSTIAIGSNFTLWMVIRERLNLDETFVPPSSCLFGSYNSRLGLMLSNGVIGCDWGNASGTIGGVMMTNWPIDLVYSQGTVYTNGVALSGTLPQPTNGFEFQAVGDIAPSTSPFIGNIQYIGIWTNTLFTAANVSNLDNWVNTNGVNNITSGLAAWWKLTDGTGTNVHDSSGNGYTGTIAGEAAWTNTSPTGGGLTFNGLNTFVTTGNVPNTWKNMSLVFWINSPNLNGSDNSSQAVPIGHSANQPTGGNAGPGWQAYFEDHYMRLLVLDASGNYAEVANQYVIDDGRWHQCVLEIGSNPTDLIGYTDGEVVTGPVYLSTRGKPVSIAANIPVTMGTVTDPKNGTRLPYFDGSLADVRIYANHLINAQEAADLFRWRGQSGVETLTVQTNGLGGIAPVDNGKLLAVGSNYTLVASPGKNCLFSNWVASGSTNFVSNNPVLKFIMQSNLTLTANFVTNPFLAVQGTYHGLFCQTNSNYPVTEQSSGFATTTIGSTSKGAYSAVLKVDGGSYSFSGMFDLNGNSVTNIKRTGKSPLTLSLHIDLNLSPPADSMTGSVLASNWDGPSRLSADLAWFNGITRKASNYAGKYTFALPGSPGYSVAEFANNLAGNAVLTGSLADNTTITSLSMPISKDGSVPIYYSYKPGTNLIFGWLNFTNFPPQTVSGDLTWFKLPAAANIIGSLYAPVTTNTLVTNGTLRIAEQGQDIELVYSNVSIISNKLSYGTTTNNQLTAIITSSTGAISLSFRPAGAKANLTAKGVMLQNSPADPSLAAAGWFLGTNQTGYFILTR